MAHKMVRQPSETANINNIDDIIPFRYAYGNQDGYVIGKGNELSYTINGNEFKINSGRVVLQGVEDDIDANGVSFTIDTVSETRYYIIYFKVNLATNTTSYEITYDTAGYPTVDVGDDLTENSSGYANLVLYQFEAISGVINNVTKAIKAIEYTGTALNGYDINNGTIEERLTRLGFNEGSITIKYGSATTNFIKRQGNYVIGVVEGLSIQYAGVIGEIPEDFRPSERVKIGISLSSSFDISVATTTLGSASNSGGASCYCYINTDGTIEVEGFLDNTIWAGSLGVSSLSNKITGIYFGYEVPPREKE